MTICNLNLNSQTFQLSIWLKLYVSTEFMYLQLWRCESLDALGEWFCLKKIIQEI